MGRLDQNGTQIRPCNLTGMNGLPVRWEQQSPPEGNVGKLSFHSNGIHFVLCPDWTGGVLARGSAAATLLPLPGSFFTPPLLNGTVLLHATTLVPKSPKKYTYFFAGARRLFEPLHYESESQFHSHRLQFTSSSKLHQQHQQQLLSGRCRRRRRRRSSQSHPVPIQSDNRAQCERD